VAASRPARAQADTATDLIGHGLADDITERSAQPVSTPRQKVR
jgi:hypothetical protein